MAATTYVVFDGETLTTNATPGQAAAGRALGSYVIDSDLWDFDLRHYGTHEVRIPAAPGQPERVLPYTLTSYAAAWAVRHAPSGTYAQRVKTTHARTA